MDWAGVALADSARALLLRETGHAPAYYFPRGDVRMDLLVATDHATACPHKGQASYWSIDMDGRTEENAVWSYQEPIAAVPLIENHMAFYMNRLGATYVLGHRAK